MYAHVCELRMCISAAAAITAVLSGHDVPVENRWTGAIHFSLTCSVIT